MYTQSKDFKTRITHKHDVQSNWLQAENKFVPLAGELIVYDADGTYTQPRYKIGNGKDLLGNLPFIDAASIIEELDYTDAPEDGKYVSAVTQSNGVIAVTKASLPAIPTVNNAKITIAPGTKLTTGGDFTTNQGTAETITLNHETTTRSNTTNSETVNYGNTFNVIDTISSDATGHITAVNTKTVTMPAAVDISGKMDKSNPTGTGSFSLNRKADTTIGSYSFAEGYDNIASGEYSHAEGYSTTASSESAHAEGSNTTAAVPNAHAEGSNTTASGTASHAEGSYTTASGTSCHAEGFSTLASNAISHAEGHSTIASGYISHAEGFDTTANSRSQHVQGEYNILDTENIDNRGTYAHIVGNGTSNYARSNAHTLDWDGNAWFSGDVYVGSTSGTNKDEGSVKLATEEYVDGVTSNIQTQLNGKQATITGAATSITSANLTANRALVSDGSGKVAVSAVTSTELGYLDGVTSAVQSQLDAKIPLAGVSDYTITGNLLFADSGTTESVFRGLQGKCGGNDYWRVGGRATANNAGYMEIATADDGNEPIYVRQYSGTYSTLTRTATLLDGSGNTSFPGRVTAAGATLTSSLNLANGIWNKLGDDVLFGDNNTAGGFAIKGTNGNTNLKMVSNSNNTSASIVYDSTNECLNFVFA